MDHQQFAFLRQFEDQKMFIVLNSDTEEVELTLDLHWKTGILIDHLNAETKFYLKNNRLTLSLPPAWGRVMSIE